MVTNEQILETIEKKKIIVIVRRTYGEDLMNLTRALYQGGIRLMECTFDQSDPDCLKKTGKPSVCSARHSRICILVRVRC